MQTYYWTNGCAENYERKRCNFITYCNQTAIMNHRSQIFPLVMVTTLFFLWVFLHNINPVLIPHLKKACQLSDTQSAFIDTAVYLVYFSMVLPAGMFTHKYSYKKYFFVWITKEDKD